MKMPWLFADINGATVTKLEERLFHALDPVNPLDAWGDGSGDWDEDLTHFIVSLADDPDTSIGAMSAELSFMDGIESNYGKSVSDAFDRTEKPVTARRHAPSTSAATVQQSAFSGENSAFQTARAALTRQIEEMKKSAA